MYFFDENLDNLLTKKLKCYLILIYWSKKKNLIELSGVATITY